MLNWLRWDTVVPGTSHSEAILGCYPLENSTRRKIKLTLETKVKHIWIQTFCSDFGALMLAHFC